MTAMSSPDDAAAGAAALPTAQDDACLRVEGLKVHFPLHGGPLRRPVGTVRAVDGLTLEVPRGRAYALVGESGCGKTTVGRALLRLVEPTAGRVHLDGQDVTALGKRELRATRQRMQMVFQESATSLNPTLTVKQALAAPLRAHGLASRGDAADRVAELLERVGLAPRTMNRYPHELSAGQRQRVGIARALATEPDFLVLDEPTSSLDISVQAQILNLLKELQDELGLTYLFISHDLSVVRHLCDTVGVMYLGKIVEEGPVEDVFTNPQHPYTQGLVSAVPVPDPTREPQRFIVKGDVPSAINPPTGCSFHPRCPKATGECEASEPDMEAREGGGRVACWHAGGGQNGDGGP